MGKPSFAALSISNKTQNWDATLNDKVNEIRTQVQEEPLPIVEFASLGDLLTAHDPADYERCVAIVDTASGWMLHMSDGADWLPIGRQTDAVADLVDSSGGTSGAGTIGAVSDVATAANAIATLAAKINELQAALRASGSMVP